MNKKKLNLEILVAFAIVLLILLEGTLFYRLYDNLSWIDSFYFTTMTVVTVGLGDIAPADPVSRLFTSIYALVSIPTILFCLGLIIKRFLTHEIDHIENKVEKIINTEKEILDSEEKILTEEKKIDDLKKQ